MICPHCGYSLDDGVAFCIYCGTRFGRFAPPEGEADAASRAQVPAEPAAGVSAEETTVLEGRPHEGAAAEAAAGGAVSDSAFELVEDYSTGEVPEAGAAAGQAPAGEPQEEPAPAAPKPAGSDQETTRLHAEDALTQRMGKVQRQDEQKSRKGVAAAVVGVLLAAGIAVGGMYVLPGIMDGDDGGSSSSAAGPSSSGTADGGSSGSSADSPSSAASGSEAEGAAGSEGTDEDKPATRRGSTLANATADDGTAEGAGGSAEGAGAGGSADGAGAGGADGSAGAGGGASAGGDAGGNAAPAPAPEPAPAPAPEPAPAPSYPAFSPSAATATSTSPTEGSTPHTPDLVLDGIPETAWNTNANGVGESITITTGSTSTVNGIRIMGGYNKIAWNGVDLYQANSRPCDVLVEYEGGSVEYRLADLKRQFQEIAINPPAATTWIKVTIKSVYQGDLYDDCCISEIQVY